MAGLAQYTTGEYTLDNFLTVMKSFDPIPIQPWRDKSGYIIIPDLEISKKLFRIEIWFYENYISISPQGFGTSQALRAVTPKELEAQIKAWILNR